MASLKKNIAYKGILTFSNYIIGLITFPYVTRVLGPDNFGIVNFALTTVDYFLLFATLGIATIGTREIAAAGNDRIKMETVFSKILSINLIFTILTLLIYFIAILLVPKFYENRALMLIGAAKIFFTAFAVEWFYTGIENFRYITIRSLTIKLVYVGSVFILVKTASDYYIYFILTILSIVINSLINFIYSKRFVTWHIHTALSKVYIKHNLRLGVYAIMTSMYITFNVMYLGLVSDDFQVGYYSTAVKLYFIAVSLFGAFTQVMMPRIASLLSSNNQQSVNTYLQKSFTLVFLTSIPLIILSEYFAPVVINIMSGDGYTNSITPMRILMPALLPVWIAQVIAVQALTPMRKDNILLISSIIGATISIILNLMITPHLRAVGSAIVLVVSETSVTLTYLFVCHTKKYVNLPSVREVMSSIAKTIPYLIISSICWYFNSGHFGALVATLLSGLYFLYSLLGPHSSFSSYK